MGEEENAQLQWAVAILSHRRGSGNGEAFVKLSPEAGAAEELPPDRGSRGRPPHHHHVTTGYLLQFIYPGHHVPLPRTSYKA